MIPRYAAVSALAWALTAHSQYHQGYIQDSIESYSASPSADSYDNGHYQQQMEYYRRLDQQHRQQLSHPRKIPALKNQTSKTISPTRTSSIPKIQWGELNLDNFNPCGGSRPPCFFNVVKDSTAYKMGIRNGDRLKFIDGRNYFQVAQRGLLNEILPTLNQGSTHPVNIVIERNGKELPPRQIQWGFFWKGYSPQAFSRKYQH